MAFLGRLLRWLAAFPSLDISVNSCEIHSTGSAFTSGSAFTIGSQPLFGVVSLALRLLTYWNFLPWLRLALPDNLFALPTEVILWCLMLAQLLNNVGPSRLWVSLESLLGTVSHPKSALFHRICPAHFASSLKLLFSPGPGLEAPLSSYLEVALYKFHR